MTVLHVFAHIAALTWHALVAAWLYITLPACVAWLGFVVVREWRNRPRAVVESCGCVGCAGDVFDQDAPFTESDVSFLRTVGVKW